MLTVQEVFDLTIELGQYHSSGHKLYMCNALYRVNDGGHITNDEYAAAMEAIKEYLGSCTVLSDFLKDNHPAEVRKRNLSRHDYSQTLDCTTVYLDWANRPGFKDGVAHANHG